MHIGVVTTSYPRHAGDGSGQFVVGLNRYLRRCGHTVEVIAAGSAPDAALSNFWPDEPVLRVPSSLFYEGGAPDALARGGSAWLEAARFSTQLGRLLARREAGYDALISHWLVPCGLLASLMAPGKPHVAIAHSSDIHLLRRCGLECVARYIARRARLVYTAASLRVPGAPGEVIPMGIETADFRAAPAERSLARERLAATAKAVLFLGRLVPVKGVAVLLEALGRQSALHLWIAGDGPQRAELLAAVAARSGLAHRVRFFGAVDAARRKELLLACDALAVPSLRLADGRTEGAPQVILEGLAAGCAVVASAVGGVPSLIGDAGRLVRPGDAAALGDALLQAVNDSAARRAQAIAAAARFDWAVIGPRIVETALTAPREWSPAR